MISNLKKCHEGKYLFDRVLEFACSLAIENLKKYALSDIIKIGISWQWN